MIILITLIKNIIGKFKRLIKVNISFSSDIDQNLKAEYEKILKKSCKQSIFIVTNNKTIEPNITLDITKLRDFNLNDPKNASFEYKLILHDINNKGWHNEPHMIPDLFGISEPQLKHPFSQSMHAAFTQFCADYAYLNLTVPKPLSPPPRFFFKLIKEPAHVDVSYLHYCLMRLMEVLIPVLISIPTLITAHELCEEKENNVHTYMVIMGLDRSLCILSHLIVALIKMYLYILPIGITMVICYKEKQGPFLTQSVKENALQSIIEENSKQQSGFNEAYFENDKNEMQADIDVIHLSKKWPNGRFGIQDVTFKAYQNQVTAILGHNGAGKSTTFSILSGLTKSTCGKAYVCGQEPPNTYFYQLLKGIDDPDEIEAMIQKLGLNDYLHYRSKYLSSGIRRKLCIGMAMVANSKVIILDEPTHGMDTLSRKQLIEIIRAAKAEHTVLLATHYMDEADAVSDRIIILSNGKVICNGSSNFLKTKVGTGFLLTVDFTNVLEPESYHDYAEAVLTIVAKNCKEAKLEGVIHQQFAILLPQGSQRLFPLIFDDLEFQRDALQINCFDIHER
uniref:ABC transporter domain-containing protein n=1 Tax=Panagrolaimus superbus TaxID=310955 RepID=A0A914XQQ2_9BILA